MEISAVAREHLSLLAVDCHGGDRPDLRKSLLKNALLTGAITRDVLNKYSKPQELIDLVRKVTLADDELPIMAIPDGVVEMLKERIRYKSICDFKPADKIRDCLQLMGYLIRDESISSSYVVKTGEFRSASVAVDS